MKKRSGPALSQQKRPLAECPECKGNCVVKPMFYELPCGRCNATGYVCKESGDSLPMEELGLQLGILVRELKEQVMQLQRKLAEERAKDNGRGYGAGGARYHGD